MNVSNFIQYLSNISQIKSVSPQKQINRVLLNYDINGEEFSQNSKLMVYIFTCDLFVNRIGS